MALTTTSGPELVQEKVQGWEVAFLPHKGSDSKMQSKPEKKGCWSPYANFQQCLTATSTTADLLLDNSLSGTSFKDLLSWFLSFC